MAESVDQTGIIEVVLVENSLHDRAKKRFIAGVVGIRDDLLHHFLYADIGAAVLGSL